MDVSLWSVERNDIRLDFDHFCKGFRCVGCPAADTRHWISEGFAAMKEAGRSAVYVRIDFNVFLTFARPLELIAGWCWPKTKRANKVEYPWISIVAIWTCMINNVYINGCVWNSHVWKLSSNFNREITCTFEFITRVPSNTSFAGSHQILHANLELETLLETGGPQWETPL